MEYGLLNGGKRMRASLVLAAARMVSGDKQILPVLSKQRLQLNVFTYSLIHDDLQRWMMRISVAVSPAVTIV